MNRVICSIVLLCVMLCFTGCSNAASEDVLEIPQEFDRNDAQVLVAFGDNFEAKKGLIQSTELSSTGLVAICTNPRPLALENSEVQDWFKNAVAQTELSAEQEVEIAKMGKVAYARALLLDPSLTPEGLVAVCENSECLNLRNIEVQGWFLEAFMRTELTAEQEVKVAKMGKYAFERALLLDPSLTPEGLVAVCENSECFYLENVEIQEAFKDAIKRTELDTEQKNRIAKSNTGGLGLF